MAPATARATAATTGLGPDPDPALETCPRLGLQPHRGPSRLPLRLLAPGGCAEAARRRLCGPGKAAEPAEPAEVAGATTPGEPPGQTRAGPEATRSSHLILATDPATGIQQPQPELHTLAHILEDRICKARYSQKLVVNSDGSLEMKGFFLFEMVYSLNLWS